MTNEQDVREQVLILFPRRLRFTVQRMDRADQWAVIGSDNNWLCYLTLSDGVWWTFTAQQYHSPDQWVEIDLPRWTPVADMEPTTGMPRAA